MAELPNILIVDDSAFLRRSVNKLLSNAGMKVFEAENLSQLRGNRFAENKRLADMDLLLLDIHLNGENGLDILPYLKKNHPTLPVVVLSMDNNKDTVLRAFNLKVNDYILKPFDEQNLINKINYYINLSEECIINPQSCSSGEDSTDEFDYFKVDLLTEINRSLRSELEFSILELNLSEQDSNIINKERLLNFVRNIDQVYPRQNNIYLFLLPLTDKIGLKEFINRFRSEFKSKLSWEKLDFTKRLSFPTDITNDIDRTKAVDYQQEIVEWLE